MLGRCLHRVPTPPGPWATHRPLAPPTGPLRRRFAETPPPTPTESALLAQVAPPRFHVEALEFGRPAAACSTWNIGVEQILSAAGGVGRSVVGWPR